MNTTITLSLPDDIASCLAAGQDLSRLTLEALALDGYRECLLSTGQVRRLLGFATRMGAHAFLKAHGVFLHYGSADLVVCRETGDALTLPPASSLSLPTQRL